MKKYFFIASDNLQTYKIKKISASIKNCFPAIMQSFKEKLGSEGGWVRRQMYSECREMACV